MIKYLVKVLTSAFKVSTTVATKIALTSIVVATTSIAGFVGYNVYDNISKNNSHENIDNSKNIVSTENKDKIIEPDKGIGYVPYKPKRTNGGIAYVNNNQEPILKEEKGMTYVALGDSVPNGRTPWQVDNLSSYADFIADELKKENNLKHFYKITHSGDTISDLTKSISKDENKSKLASADVITLSVGANDILQDKLFEIIQHDMYDLASGKITLTQSVFDQILNTIGKGKLEGIVKTVSDAQSKVDAIVLRYKKLLGLIKSINSRAKIVIVGYHFPFVNYPAALKNEILPLFDKILGYYQAATKLVPGVEFVNIFHTPGFEKSSKFLPNFMDIHTTIAGHQEIAHQILLQKGNIFGIDPKNYENNISSNKFNSLFNFPKNTREGSDMNDLIGLVVKANAHKGVYGIIQELVNKFQSKIPALLNSFGSSTSGGLSGFTIGDDFKAKMIENVPALLTSDLGSYLYACLIDLESKAALNNDMNNQLIELYGAMDKAIKKFMPAGLAAIGPTIIYDMRLMTKIELAVVASDIIDHNEITLANFDQYFPELKTYNLTVSTQLFKNMIKRRDNGDTNITNYYTNDDLLGLYGEFNGSDGTIPPTLLDTFYAAFHKTNFTNSYQNFSARIVPPTKPIGE